MAKASKPGAAEPAGNNDSPKGRPFDVQTIRHLVALMSRHDLTEIDLREGELRIRLRRGTRGKVVAQVVPPSAAETAPAPTSAPAAPAATAPAPAAQPEKHYQFIKSPTPGTFYGASSPDAEPFVRVGARVSPTTVVCIIEAMKIFNEIPADCSGVIAEVLVENGSAVEYDQPLFKVDPTG
jgi:acetyl-CoA carboxylase biotin carboxyl carrier protein